MSLLNALSQTPLVDERGFITREWFRYLTGANPTTGGAANEVLHGNAGGSYPTWGPVDLTADVEGELPVANGGIGNLVRQIGGILYFPDANTIASSGPLADRQVVIGGGAAGPRTVSPGSLGTTLHYGTVGDPFWSFVNLSADVSGFLNLGGQVTGVLPVVHGGTGTVAATGTGAVVLDTGCIITPLQISGGTWVSAHITGTILWNTGAGAVTQLSFNDSGTTTVATGPTTIMAPDGPMFWIAYDKNQGGMAFGTMDTHMGINVVASNMINVTFTRSAGNGLQATITGAPFTRDIACVALSTGSP